jgi:hypothetical protein
MFKLRKPKIIVVRNNILGLTNQVHGEESFLGKLIVAQLVKILPLPLFMEPKFH